MWGRGRGRGGGRGAEVVDESVCACGEEERQVARIIAPAARASKGFVNLGDFFFNVPFVIMAPCITDQRNEVIPSTC